MVHTRAGLPQMRRTSILCCWRKTLNSNLQDRSWIHTFGRVVSQDTEHYGNLVSLRVHYEGGLEVEFGLTDPNWAAVPLDPGPSEVISAGMKVLFERGPILSRHVQ